MSGGKIARNFGQFPNCWCRPEILNEMKVQLISIDSDLRKLCQDILAQLGCRNCHISGGMVEDSDSDLCIWDYAPDMTLPSEADWVPPPPPLSGAAQRYREFPPSGAIS